MNYLQAWSYTEAMASVAPGLGLGALQKFPIDFKIFQWKCPLKKRKWPCLFNKFKDEIPERGYNSTAGSNFMELFKHKILLKQKKPCLVKSDNRPRLHSIVMLRKQHLNTSQKQCLWHVILASNMCKISKLFSCLSISISFFEIWRTQCYKTTAAYGAYVRATDLGIIFYIYELPPFGARA